MRFERMLESALLPFPVFLVAAALTGCGGGRGGNSVPVPTPTPTPTATLSLSASPSSLTVTASDAFFVTVTATESGTSATPTISLGTLPAGLSTTSTFPMSVPAAGAVINFTTSSSIAPGNVTVPISGAASSATATSSIALNVVSGAPNQLGFAIPLSNEVELPQGTSTSVQSEFISTNTHNPTYEVTLSATGLPSGVTASISPQVVEAGGAYDESFTVTLAASSTAPVTQNVQWGIVATPTASVPPTTANYLLDVTPAAGGAGWSNQTSYVSTRATPFSAVYDPAHGLIYSANQVWDRVDVISDKTRAIVKSISIQDPRGMDISIDGSTIWVATGCQVMYGINTTTFQATQYILPRYGVTSTSAGISWEGSQVFSLADGTVLLVFTNYTGSGYEYGAIWNPATGAFTQTANPAAWSVVARSGDGTRVFSFGGDEDETSFTYDVSSQTFSKAISLSSFGYAEAAASNQNGSMVAVSAFGETPFALYDSNLNLIGLLPGDGGVSGAGTFPAENLLGGGFIFGPDGQTIYEETESTAIPAIVSIDAATQQITGLGPAMPVIPVFTELSPPYLLPAPFAVDSAGMLLGIEYQGIAFDDTTAHLNYSSFDLESPTFMQHMSPYSGPLAGGTTSGGFGNGFSQTPDVYYGSTKGAATLSSQSLSITSPPAASPGPVDIKMLFPDGTEVFNPQFFTYGTKIQDAIISGGSPQGGAAAKLDAFGLPLDPSQDAVTVGGENATVTSTTTQYPPFTGEQTDMYLSYTAPSGDPGWADLTVTTSNGTSTLPKSFFFAKSVTDYSTTDSPTFVLYDAGRNQLYLSAGDHIDVFSLSSDSFTTPLQPPAVGTKKQFEGLTLTPDGKYLLAADLADYSLAVIDPDSPSGAYA
ncbi:MAG: IPT/TIG domain-containing protein, partial [Terriglobia bacterium]